MGNVCPQRAFPAEPTCIYAYMDSTLVMSLELKAVMQIERIIEEWK